MLIQTAFKALFCHRISRPLALFLIGLFFWLIASPVKLPSTPYFVIVPPHISADQLADQLAQDHAIRSRHLMCILTRLFHVDKKIQAGRYSFKKATSLLGMLQVFSSGQVDPLSITIIEGMNIYQMRNLLNKAPDLQHNTKDFTNRTLLQKIGIKNSTTNRPEGLFFPSTYFYQPQSSDITILQKAYQKMQQTLRKIWQHRDSNLPYKNPQQLLIMASLVEKETANPKDRPKIAAVLINRLKIHMRLQTDPTVMYGINPYLRHLTYQQLHQDTAYNTYTRTGLPPTPIALPSEASLVAAAHPDKEVNALYFVARGDGSSALSKNLTEHNAAVQKYILKKSK